MVVSFVLSVFPRDVFGGILDLIGSVSKGVPTYSWQNIRLYLFFLSSPPAG